MGRITRRLAEQEAIRRYPIRKVTTPVPVEGDVVGGALPMTAGTSFHGRRKPNGSAFHRRIMAGVQDAAKHAIRAMSPLKSWLVEKPQPNRKMLQAMLVAVLKVQTEEVPQVPDSERVLVEGLGGNFHRILVRNGFLEHPNVTAALMRWQLGAPELTDMETSFFLSRESLIPSDRPDLQPWREQIFMQMANTAPDATRYSDCRRIA
jgi:K+ transporter